MQQQPARDFRSSAQLGTPSSRHHTLFAAILAMALLVLTLASCVPMSGPSVTAQNTVAQSVAPSISPSVLEDQYGTRVNLMAVTAVGGLVDLRMKILDAAKARQLFLGKAPSLRVEGSGVILTAPEDSQAQVEQLQDGGVVFILYPNISNAVKRGDKVTVMFGDVRLQPIAAQ